MDIENVATRPGRSIKDVFQLLQQVRELLLYIDKAIKSSLIKFKIDTLCHKDCYQRLYKMNNNNVILQNLS